MARSIAEIEHSTVRKVSKRLIPFLFLCFAISILDRLNISFAALQMNETLNFSNEVYGLGAGIFFIGYFLLEVPGGALMTKFGARKWISRIMISWGIISGLTAFVTTPAQFYAVRFALGVAEASFFRAWRGISASGIRQNIMPEHLQALWRQYRRLQHSVRRFPVIYLLWIYGVSTAGRIYLSWKQFHPLS